jgi:tetraacyldisaccharide 4'-kinase
MSRPGLRAAMPVLCIGNFVAGGAGKTPTAIAIARHLQSHGETPVFLSRGYRGKAGHLPRLVDERRHSVEDVGDEALLLARVAPTIVGADRVASAVLAQVTGASLIILDDGLQNSSLVQDLRLAVVDGRAGIGNGLCIPAGPLRAPFCPQLASVSAVLFIGEGPALAELAQTAGAFGKPVLTAKLVAQKDVAYQFAGQPVLAFAGIGLPGKFKATLAGLGAKIAGWQSFPDHHVYSLQELRHLQSQAAQRQAFLVTTEKDFVRIAPLLGGLDQNLPKPVALPVDLVFDDERVLDDLVMKALKTAQTVIGAGN